MTSIGANIGIQAVHDDFAVVEREEIVIQFAAFRDFEGPVVKGATRTRSASRPIRVCTNAAVEWRTFTQFGESIAVIALAHQHPGRRHPRSVPRSALRSSPLEAVNMRCVRAGLEASRSSR